MQVVTYLVVDGTHMAAGKEVLNSSRYIHHTCMDSCSEFRRPPAGQGAGIKWLISTLRDGRAAQGWGPGRAQKRWL